LPLIRPGIRPEVLERSVRHFRLTAAGGLRESEDWRYGLAIDDIIAHVHDRDPSLLWNSRQEDAEAKISAPLAWLNRARRIALGKQLLKKCEEARDGDRHYFAHYQRARSIAIVFLATGEPRESRVDHLRFLVDAAQVEYD